MIEVPNYWVYFMSNFSALVLVQSFHLLKQLFVCVSLNWDLMSSWNQVKIIWYEHMLSPFMNVSSCHSMPLNTLAPCLNLCSILQHMANLRWLSSRCHQPISASLEVRTCHLSESWSLLHNYMLLCHNWWNTQTLHAHETWKSMEIMSRNIATGLRKAPWTNLKPGRKTATYSVFNFAWVLSLRKIISSIKPLFGMNMCCLRVTDKSVYWVKSPWRKSIAFLQRLLG